MDEFELSPYRRRNEKLPCRSTNLQKIQYQFVWNGPNGQVHKKAISNILCLYYGWLFSVIDADGKIYPCCFQDRSPSCAIGNINEDDFKRYGFPRNINISENSSKILMIGDKMALYNQPSCFFNNNQVYDYLHKLYLSLSHTK